MECFNDIVLSVDSNDEPANPHVTGKMTIELFHFIFH